MHVASCEHAATGRQQPATQLYVLIAYMTTARTHWMQPQVLQQPLQPKQLQRAVRGSSGSGGTAAEVLQARARRRNLLASAPLKAIYREALNFMEQWRTEQGGSSAAQAAAAAAAAGKAGRGGR